MCVDRRRFVSGACEPSGTSCFSWYPVESEIGALSVEKLPPPLLGFNNNVRYHGRMFHIQTEDSGVKHARIVTHLFADGGRILRTTRTDYTDKLGHKDMTELLRRLMKQQHRAMFIALRAGELDAAIGTALGSEGLEPSGHAGGGLGHSAQASLPSPASSGSLPPSLPPLPKPSSASGPDDTIPIVNKPTPERSSTSSRPGKPPPPIRPGSARAKARQSAAAADGIRPASLFELPMPGTSLFTEGVVTEQSLDDTILSYLDDEQVSGEK